MKEQLQHLRKSKGLTQDEFADIIGVKLTTYQKYERDVISPSYDTLLKIADFYNVTTDYLLGREQNKEDSLDNLKVRHALEKDSERLVQEFIKLNPEHRKAILDMMRKAINSNNDNPIGVSLQNGQPEERLLGAARSSERDFIPLPTEAEENAAETITDDYF